MTPHNDWTDRLRTRLRDAELTPSERGWARLDEALHTPAAAPRRRLGARILPYRLPIAAALLVGALLTDLYLHPTVERTPSSEPQPFILLDDEGPTADNRPAAPAVRPAAGLLAARRPASGTAAPQPLAQQPTVQEPAATKPDDARKEPDTSKTPSVPKEPAAPATTARPHQAAAPPAVPKPAASKPARRRTSVALFGSGLPTLGGRHAHPASSALLLQDGMASVTYATGNADLAANRRTDYTHSEFSHRQPWSVGLTLRKELKYGLSIETGLVYTALKSTVTTRGRACDQQLHLLGVPLRLNWAFVDRPNGALYLGAGGMLERCIRARLGSMRCSEHDLQASLGAVLGGEYRLTPSAALYAEPEWSCSLTDTGLRTVRTDRPVTFTLRVGLRFTF